MRLLLIAIVATMSLFPSVAMTQETARMALLVGNMKYHSDVGPLTNPVNDIAIIGNALKKLGFKITTVADADLATLTRKINAYVRTLRGAGPDAVGFFYYSGHGAKNETTGIDYLIPVDITSTADAGMWDRALRMSEVTAKFRNEAGNAVHFVVFDACRNNLRLVRPGTKAPIQSKGFSAVRDLKGMLVAYSTAEGEVASDAGQGSGPYARTLAEEIVKPGVEAVAMFRRVQLRLNNQIGQTPYVGFDALREVYFAGQADAGAPATVTASVQTPPPTASARGLIGKADSVCKDLRALTEMAKQDFVDITGTKAAGNAWTTRAKLFGYRDCEVRRIGATTQYSCSAAPQSDSAKALAEMRKIADGVEKCLAPEWKASSFNMHEMVTLFGPHSIFVSASLMPTLDIGTMSARGATPQLTIYQNRRNETQPPEIKEIPKKPDGFCENLKVVIKAADDKFDSIINPARKSPRPSRVQPAGWSGCHVSDLSGISGATSGRRYFSCKLGPFGKLEQANAMAGEIASDVHRCLGSEWSVKKSLRTIDGGADYDFLSADIVHTAEVLVRQNVDDAWEINLDVNMRE